MTTNITTTRRQNLLILLQEFAEQHLSSEGTAKGAEQSFAAFIQISPSRLSQIKSSVPIGNKLAHQIEVACKRAPGWLSESRSEMKPSAAEIAFLVLAREAWLGQNSEGKRSLMKNMQNLLLVKK